MSLVTHDEKRKSRVSHRERFQLLSAFWIQLRVQSTASFNCCYVLVLRGGVVPFPFDAVSHDKVLFVDRYGRVRKVVDPFECISISRIREKWLGYSAF